MATFESAISKGAERLKVPEDVLAQVLKDAQITSDVWIHVTQADFQDAVESRLKTKVGTAPSAFLVRAAYGDMNQVLQGVATGLPKDVTSSKATIEQLISALDMAEPQSDVMTELL